MATWGQFEVRAPDLASFGAALLLVGPSYLATVRNSGTPRVHPVTPIIGAGELFLFMEPTSPKGHDLRAKGAYALHNGVPDMSGTGGEFWVRGSARFVDDPGIRDAASAASQYVPADRYILFVLGVAEARCNGYGDVDLPATAHWVDEDTG